MSATISVPLPEFPGLTCTLQQRRKHGVWGMAYCYLGETKQKTSESRLVGKARENARTKAPAMMRFLQLQAAAKGKTIPGATQPPTEVTADVAGEDDASGQKPVEELPALDLSLSPPQDSFRAGIVACVAFELSKLTKKSTQRQATDSRKHIYAALGGYVDLPLKKMDGGMGDRLAAFFNYPKRYPLVCETYASRVCQLIRPLEAEGLPKEFLLALDKVKKQGDGDEASDPLLPDHYRRIHLRLATGEEEDCFAGLHYIGSNAAPQLIDVVLLLWEGVDFPNRWIKLYREKTKVIAEFAMTERDRAWLLRRRDEAPRDALYVFWELACLKSERGEPSFNQTVVPDNRISTVSSTSGTAWRGFLHRAGINVGLMTFLPGDIKDLKGFIMKLQERPAPEYAWFLAHCKPICRKALLKIPTTQQELDKLEELLIRNLTLFVEGEFAYDEEVLGHVQLRCQTRALLNPECKGVYKYKFHRLLLEDLFPELKRVETSAFSYTYGSYRKALVSFLRGMGYRDPLIAAILGQDALDSQNAYDRVGAFEINQVAKLLDGHNEAMITGKTEFFATVPNDLYVKILELFHLQDEAREWLIADYRRLHEAAEKRAQQRHDEMVGVVQRSGHETRAVLAQKIETTDERTEQRFAAMEAHLSSQDEMLRHLASRLPDFTRLNLTHAFVVFMQFLAIQFLRMTFGKRQRRLGPPIIEIGPIPQDGKPRSEVKVYDVLLP
ncbi:MAG: hypothetical protein P4N59_31450 [Negativicutes bacterium]|nr:hypothetical protein [Negativicutes bacterium]